MTTLPNILQRINWMLGAGVVFRVLSAITTLSMTYFLVPAIYAEYSFAMSLSLLTALIAAAGLPDYIVSRANNGRFQTATLVWQSWLLNFLLGGICLGIIYLVIFRQSISTAGKWGIFFINIATIFASANVISQAALRSIHRVETQAKLMLLSISLSTSTLVFTAWKWGEVQLIGFASLVVFGIMFIIHATLLKRYSLVQQTPAPLRTLTQLLRHTFPYGIVLILEMAIPVTASYIVLTRFNPELAGSFNLMITLLLSAMMIATALDQTFYPVLVSSQLKSRPNILAAYLLFSLFIVVPAFIIFFFHAQAIATISIFQKYEQLTAFVALLAYLVPLHFIAKVCTVFFRLQDNQKLSIVMYLMALIWIVVRSAGKNVEPINVGQFMIEGQLLILAVLSISMLTFVSSRDFYSKMLKLLVPTTAALLITFRFANNLLVLTLSLVSYLTLAWGMRLHKDLLALTNKDS